MLKLRALFIVVEVEVCRYLVVVLDDGSLIFTVVDFKERFANTLLFIRVHLNGEANRVSVTYVCRLFLLFVAIAALDA